MSAEAIIGFGAALLGALAGGAATFLVERQLRRNDQEDTLKAGTIGQLVYLVLMTSDLQTLDRMIKEAVEENADELQAGAQIWQTIYALDMKPSVAEIDPQSYFTLVKLGDRKLVEKMLEFSSAYFSNIARIEQYHRYRDEFEAHMNGKFYMDAQGKRRFPPSADAQQLALEARLHNHMEFLRVDIARLAEEGSRLQKLMFEVAERRFGSADFLRLSKT